MKNILILLLTTLSLRVFAGGENWHDQYCRDCDGSTISREAFPKVILALGSVTKQSIELEKKIHREMDDWMEFNKWLNNHPTSYTPKELKETAKRWQSLEEQAQALIEVHKLLGVSERKLEYCRTRCTRLHILELEDEVVKHKKLMSGLTKLAKWWASEEFTEVTKKARASETFTISQGDLKKVFSTSLETFAAQGTNFWLELLAIQKVIDEGLKKGQSTDYVIDNLIMKHGPALDLVLRRGIREGSTELCSLANQKYAWDRSMATSTKALKLTLTAATMIPTGGASSTAAPLIAKGLSTVAKYVPKGQIAKALPGVLLSGKLVQERLVLEDKCDKDLVSLKLGEKEGAEWVKCLEEKKDASLEAVLTILPAVAGPALPYGAKLLEKMQKSASARYGYHITSKAEGKHLTALDLSEKRLLKSQELESISGSYWEYVANIYRKRLNLSEEEIKSFIESSKQVESRTHLIVATKGAPKDKVFEGGVAMVRSSKAKDLLPLEKATGLRLPRPKGNIAEIVRLTAEENPNLMKELIQDISKLTKLDKNLKTLYVYTSNIHLRLYRKMGIPHEVIAKPVERDVVIKIDVKDWHDSLAN